MSVKPENIDQQHGINQDIEMFLYSAEFLELDFEFGVLELNKYLQDLLYLRQGVKYKDLGISDRRAAFLPKCITPIDGSVSYKTVNQWSIYNESGTPPGSIAMLKVAGVMRTESGISAPGMDRFVENMRAAYNNGNVKGVIVQTNSGGGESSAGNIAKAVIMERNKPVVGLADTAASAAYRMLSGADEIIANGEQSIFGSLGTMITMDNKMLTKIRDRYTDIYGKDAPNKNIEHRQAMEGDFSGLQKRVDLLTKQFHDEIKKDRPLQGSPDVIENTLSGEVFRAADAKRRGLIDAIGGLPFAIQRINSLAKKY